MRLICPNCAAQYEVDAQMIPPTGRDVQCSNCGQMWFQAPEGVDPQAFAAPSAPEWPDDDAPEDAPAGSVASDDTPAPDLPAPPPEIDHAPPPVETTLRPDLAMDQPVNTAPASPVAAPASPPARPRISAGSDDGDIYEEELGGEPMDPVTPAAQGAVSPVLQRPRRNLNEAVLSVLREEAEREARARRAAPSDTFERQSELPLDSAPAPRLRFEPPAAAEPPARPATAAAPPPPQPPMAAPSAPPPRPEAPIDEDDGLVPDANDTTERPAHRRDLLPDIEVINSTLRATSERSGDGASVDAPETLRRQRSGFRLGFGLMLSLAVVILAFYRLGPGLASAVPALAGPIDAAIDAIDAARLWLDGLVRALL